MPTTLTSVANHSDATMSTGLNGWLTLAERLWIPCGPNRNIVKSVDLSAVPTITDLGTVAANQPQQNQGFDKANTLLATRRSSTTRLFQSWVAGASGEATVAASSFGSTNDVGTGGGVAIKDEVLYEAHDLNATNAATPGMSVWDLSVPATPSLLYQSGLAYTPDSLFRAGDYLYITDTATELEVYDITTPSAPSFVGTATVTGANFASDMEWRVAANESFAVAWYSSGRVDLIDLSTPTAPTLAATIAAPTGYGASSGVRGLVFLKSDTELLVASQDIESGAAQNRIRQYDISTLASPTLVDRFDIATADVPTTRFPRVLVMVDRYPVLMSTDGTTSAVVNVLDAIPAIVTATPRPRLRGGQITYDYLRGGQRWN